MFGTGGLQMSGTELRWFGMCMFNLQMLPASVSFSNLSLLFSS